MYVLEKNLDDIFTAKIHVDYHCNGRLYINNQMVTNLDFSKESKSRFIEAGWKHVPSTNSHHFVQHGNYAGCPNLVEWLDSYPEYSDLLENYISDTENAGKGYYRFRKISDIEKDIFEVWEDVQCSQAFGFPTLI